MKRFGREIALLTLPVLIFGGLALWKVRGGSVAQFQGAPSDIYSGKPRLEIGEIKPLELTPWDVAQGFVWGADVTTWQGGASPVAASVKTAAFSSGSGARVFYRQGTRWIEAKSPANSSLVGQGIGRVQMFGNFALRNTTQLKVSLDSVPLSAEEVRLRCTFHNSNIYQNGGCRGVMPGPSWKIYNTGTCSFATQSKTFDIPIVAAKGAWPNPKVSRVTPLALVDAKVLVGPYGQDYVLQLRRSNNSAWEHENVVVQSAQLFDADKQAIRLLNLSGKESDLASHMGSYAQEVFSSKRARTDLFVPFLTDELKPKNGWSNVKFPLTLRAEVSDGNCWPLKINTKVERVEMRTEDFGAAK